MANQTKYANKLQGKRVLVLGGTSGIGFTTAEASVESGATVIVSSSNSSRIDSTLSRLQSSYPTYKSNVSGFVCDLGNDSSLENNVLDLLKKSTDGGSKKLDHIVFTAADPLAVKPLKEFSLDEMHAAGRIRFFAPLLLAKHAPDYMKNSHESSIAVTTGGVSERPIPSWSVIGSFATGLHGMARSLALDLAPIRVNCVSPGAVDTELWKGMPEDKKQELFEGVKKGTTTGKVATPEDVAESYLYLMRDHNVTGSVISTNGGHLIK